MIGSPINSGYCIGNKCLYIHFPTIAHGLNRGQKENFRFFLIRFA